MIAAVDSLAGEKADRRLLCHWTCQVSVCNLRWNQCNITFIEFCDQGVVASASLVSTFASRNRYAESKDTVFEISLRQLLYSSSGSRFQYWVYICSTFFGFHDNFWGGSHYFFGSCTIIYYYPWKHGYNAPYSGFPLVSKGFNQIIIEHRTLCFLSRVRNPWIKKKWRSLTLFQIKHTILSFRQKQ